MYPLLSCCRVRASLLMSHLVNSFFFYTPACALRLSYEWVWMCHLFLSHSLSLFLPPHLSLSPSPSIHFEWSASLACQIYKWYACLAKALGHTNSTNNKTINNRRRREEEECIKDRYIESHCGYKFDASTQTLIVKGLLTHLFFIYEHI